MLKHWAISTAHLVSDCWSPRVLQKLHTLKSRFTNQIPIEVGQGQRMSLPIQSDKYYSAPVNNYWLNKMAIQYFQICPVSINPWVQSQPYLDNEFQDTLEYRDTISKNSKTTNQKHLSIGAGEMIHWLSSGYSSRGPGSAYQHPHSSSQL